MADEQRLSHEEVRAIAELAKLDLSDDEVATYTQQLSQILDYFTLLQEVDTSHVDTLDAAMTQQTVMRDDTPAEPLQPKTAVANAPEAEANQFKVSAVLGDE